MSRYFIKLLILFLLLPVVFAQQQQSSYSNPVGGNINATSSNCSVVSSCIWQKLPITATTTTVTLTVPVAFTGTVLIETSADGGNTFSTQSTQTGTIVVTFTTTSLTDVRARCSAYTSGTITANIQTAGNQINISGGGGGATPSGAVGNLQTNNGAGGLGALATTISGSNITFPGTVTTPGLLTNGAGAGFFCKSASK